MSSVALAGSERGVPSGVHSLGRADAGERLEVSVIVRPPQLGAAARRRCLGLRHRCGHRGAGVWGITDRYGRRLVFYLTLCAPLASAV
jgi:hypothetical protein